MKFSTTALPVLAATAAIVASAHSHANSPFQQQRRHAALTAADRGSSPSHGRMLRRSVKLAARVPQSGSGVVNATTSGTTSGASNVGATVGDVVASRNITQEVAGGSPYNIAAALANLEHSTNVMLAQKRSLFQERGNDDEEEDCEEEEDDDGEDCEEDDDEADDSEEDCDEEDGSTAPTTPNFTADPSTGSGSSASTPSDLAQDSLTAEKGCTKFAKVVSGDTCYKILGQRDDYVLSKFYANNPAVHNDCRNLEIGVSYCVAWGTASSTGGNDDKASAAPAPTEKTESKEEAAAPTTSSRTPIQVAVEVKPTQQKEEPKPATTQSPKPEPTPQNNNGGGAKKDYTGHATYYYQHGNAGACGKKNPDSAYIVALHPSLYQNGARCGKGISITNTKTGKTLEAVVADLCPTCEGAGHVDLSDGLFKALGNGADGVFDIAFGFN